MYEKWLDGDPATDGYKFFRMSTDAALEAGHVSPDWYRTFFGLVSEEMQETRKRGAFASYEGTIFQTFDPRVHVFDHDREDATGKLVLPKGVWHRRAMDWGSSIDHPMVCLWAYRDPTGRYVVYDEYWSNSQTLTILDHRQAIVDRHPWPRGNPYYGVSYGDPSRPDMFRLFALGGVAIQSANNAVYDGIETVRRMLKVLPSLNGPRLLIDRQNCPNLIREMRIYRWKKTSGKGINPQVARPEPLKMADDTCDALRYLLHTDAGLAMNMAPKITRETRRLGVGVQLAGERTGKGSRGMASGGNGNGNGYRR
jgi:hypothetical protein